MNENIKEIIKRNELYSDQYFLPCLERLIPSDLSDLFIANIPHSYLIEYKTYKWIRSKDIFMGEFNIFSGNIKQTDIRQGSLGNCYLMSALIGIAKYQERIYNLLITQKVNNLGAYTVRLFVQGQVKLVTIDDNFPCNERKRIAFSETIENELWLPLIEKAWAKLNDYCYLKTWFGIPSEALFALSEAPTIFENNRNFLREGLLNESWKRIQASFTRKWVICANTETVINTEKMGLVESHAYTVLNCYEFDLILIKNYKLFLTRFKKKYPCFLGKKMRLLKIRNPWGIMEWNGDFSNNSEIWTDELKKEVNYQEDHVDGVFYMTFEDFCFYFPWTFICKIEENYYYRYGKFHQSKNFTNVKYTEIKRTQRINSYDQSLDVEINKEKNIYPFSYFFIEVQTNTHCFICLHQPQKRFMKNYLKETITLKDYKIPIAQIILVKYEESINHYKFIKSDFINWEKIYLEVKLEPGEYHIYCRVLWEYPNIDCKLVLSTYSDFPLEIYQMKKFDNYHHNLYNEIKFSDENWLFQILKQVASTSNKKDFFSQQEPTSYFSFNIFENSIGFGVFYYKNNSKEGTIHALIRIDKINGMRLLNCLPNKDGEYCLMIPPEKDYLVIFEILDLQWESSLSWTHLKWFEYGTDFLLRQIKSKECEKLEYENGSIVFSKISHGGGFLIHIENKSENEYKCFLKFTDLTNLSVIDCKFKNNSVDFILLKMSAYYFQIKYLKKNKFFCLKIQKKFEKFV